MSKVNKHIIIFKGCGKVDETNEVRVYKTLKL